MAKEFDNILQSDVREVREIIFAAQKPLQNQSISQNFKSENETLMSAAIPICNTTHACRT